jgi:hypothetical protein
MTFDATQYIPLTEAYLCQDCDSVGNNSRQCPACASEVLMCLASVFDRKEAIEEAGVLRFPALAA